MRIRPPFLLFCPGPEVKITDADFADDLALLTNKLEEAQEFLLSLEKASNAVGLHLNESKTNYLPINSPHGIVKASSGMVLDAVDDFVYLGAHLDNPEHEFAVRKTKAWAACHQMKKIWSSKMRRQLKIRLFIATVESIILPNDTLSHIIYSIDSVDASIDQFEASIDRSEASIDTCRPL